MAVNPTPLASRLYFINHCLSSVDMQVLAIAAEAIEGSQLEASAKKLLIDIRSVKLSVDVIAELPQE